MLIMSGARVYRKYGSSTQFFCESKLLQKKEIYFLNNWEKITETNIRKILTFWKMTIDASKC